MSVPKIVTILSLSALTLFVSCKPSDTDVQKNVTEVLKTSPGVIVEVKDGVATLTGNVEDPVIASAAVAAAEKVKGVKSVTNNVMVTPAPVAPQPQVAITPDEMLNNAVKDATKDFPGITTTVTDGVIAVNGTLSASKWKTLKMSLDALQPKKVDAKGLTIK